MKGYTKPSMTSCDSRSNPATTAPAVRCSGSSWTSPAGVTAWSTGRTPPTSARLGVRCSTLTPPASRASPVHGIAILGPFKLWQNTFKRPKADQGKLLNPWCNRLHISVNHGQSYDGVMYTPELLLYLEDLFIEFMPFYLFLQEM